MAHLPSKFRSTSPLRALLFGGFLLLCCGTAWASEHRAIPPGREDDILALFEPHRLGDTLPGGYQWTGLSIEKHGFVASIISRESAPAEIRLTWKAQFGTTIGTNRSVAPELSTLPAGARQSADELIRAVDARLGRDTWDSLFIGIQERVFGKQEREFFAIAVVAALLLLGLGFWSSRIQSRSLRFLLGATGAVVGLAPAVRHASTLRSIDLSLASEHQLDSLERLFVVGMLAAAFTILGTLLVRAAVRAWRTMRERKSTPSIAPWLLDVAMVGAWSLFVRFGLTATNILTDGGSGWGRLLWYRRGHSGISVLVDFVRSGSPMHEAIAVPQFVAALSAPLLVAIARELGFGRIAGLLAGLAMASLPIHAAMYSSDFGTGAVLSLNLLGLWLVLRGARSSDPLSILGGTLVVAYAIWGRPEALSIGLPLLVTLLPFRAHLLNPAALGGLAWVAGSALTRVGELNRNTPVSAVRDLLALPNVPFVEFASSSILAPWWLWASVPLALLAMRRNHMTLFLAAFYVHAVAPFSMVSPARHDELELVRYGTSFFALFAWLSALGWDRLGGLLARRMQGGASRVPVAHLTAAVVAVAMLATPLLNRDYLARTYGPSQEYRVFSDFLRTVSGACLVVVPDDEDLTETASGSMEILGRYYAIAEEASAAGLSRITSENLVGTSRFLAGERTSDCVLHFRGVACFDGGPVEPVSGCDDLAELYELERIDSTPVEFFSHRLVARPHWRKPPLYDPDFTFDVFRVTGPKDEVANDDAAEPSAEIP